MQIVIDITPEAMDDIKNDRASCCFLKNKILNGTPLPKGHGDLIDRAELYNQTAEWEAQARDEWRWWSAVLKERGAFKHDVANAPTIIEADKEDKDE